MRCALLVTGLFFSLGIGVAGANELDDNVVVVGVTKVLLPKNLPGKCQIRGIVEQVRNGSAFRHGQTISLAVPCGSQVHRENGPAISADGPIFQDIEVLKRSKQGFAHLSDAGELIWQPTRESYGTFGRAVGYRVLDGVSLEISPASPI